MRRVSTRLLAVVAAVFLACLTGIPAAQAAGGDICGNGGSGYCMNAWNGGPVIRMYYGGVTNDDFFFQRVYPCSGSSLVQSTAHGEKTNCPFTNATLDSQLYNAQITEIADGNIPGQCIGTGDVNGTPDVGYLGSCGNIYGTGAINGAFDVITYDPSGQCSGKFLINRYWTNTFTNEGLSEVGYVVSGGNPGTALAVGLPVQAPDVPTCWG